MANAVRIIDVPPDEAPLEVRASWVGLILPLARQGKRINYGIGVLSGPRSSLGRLWSVWTRRVSTTVSYQVHVLTALSILEYQHPEAAQWWRTHTPHMIRPGHMFLFAADVCREEEPIWPPPPLVQ